MFPICMWSSKKPLFLRVIFRIIQVYRQSITLIPTLILMLTPIRTYICIQVNKRKHNRKRQLQQQAFLFQVNIFPILIKNQPKQSFNGFVLLISASAPPGYPRPNLLPPREMPLGLHHPADLLSRPYADQLAHQVCNKVDGRKKFFLLKGNFNFFEYFFRPQHTNNCKGK